MIKIFLLVTGIFLYSFLFGSTPDSTLFNTQFERNTFQLLFENSGIDSIDLFMALDYKPVVPKDKLYGFIINLKDKTAQYPMSKKLKTIYKSVHDKYLVKYSEDSYFNDIFVNGNYNCVTATALFALVLEQTGIKYQIMEKPEHVYLIADPENTGFLIESTLPAQKIIEFDDRVKNTYIQYLHNNKIISDDEFKNTSTVQLFEKYFLKDKKISLRNLAALQYYNRGVSIYNKQAYADALTYFEKASLLYKSDPINFMKYNTFVNILNADLTKKKFNGKILAQYINANERNETGSQFGKEIFDAACSELAVNKPDMTVFKKFFIDFSENLNIADTADYYRAYYFFLGYFHTVNYHYSSALSYLSKSYDFNPDNIATREMITLAISKAWLTDRNHRETIDSLEYYLDRLPFLKYDPNMIAYTEYCYAKTIEKTMEDELPDQTATVLRDMERFMYRYNDFGPNKDNVTQIYNQIGYYYMMIGKVDEAEQLVRHGLRMAPDAVSLKNLLIQLRKLKNGSYEFPEMMSDSRPLKKYLLGLAEAKDNADLINENVPANLAKRWRISAPAGMNMIIDLLPDDKAEVTNEKGLSNGNWSYNSKKCILAVTLENDKRTIHIIITELLPDRLKGLFYQNENYENTSVILMIPDESKP